MSDAAEFGLVVLGFTTIVGTLAGLGRIQTLRECKLPFEKILAFIREADVLTASSSDGEWVRWSPSLDEVALLSSPQMSHS